MGLTNPDGMIMANGCQLSNCYLTFTEGACSSNTCSYAQPLTFSATTDSTGSNLFYASGNMYTYLNKASRDSGRTPIQCEYVTYPANDSAAGVFSVFYSALKTQYTNGVVDGTGLTNSDGMIMDNGCQLSNCYLTFSAGKQATEFNNSLCAQPLTFSRKKDDNGSNLFFANGNVYTYLDKASRDAGLTPIQSEYVSYPANNHAVDVFSVFYSALKTQYSSGVVEDDVT